MPPKTRASFILVDMEMPGFSVRPIELISGASPFCETFFDDVKVSKDNLVGKRGEGWAMAKKLLEYERQNVSAIGFGGDRIVSLAELLAHDFAETGWGLTPRRSGAARPGCRTSWPSARSRC